MVRRMHTAVSAGTIVAESPAQISERPFAAGVPVLSRAELGALLQAGLEDMDERDLRLLELRILAPAGKHRLQDVGELFAVSRERARQLQVRVLRRLRHWRGMWDQRAHATMADLRLRLGSAMPAKDVLDTVSDMADLSLFEGGAHGSCELAQQLLLWLAGPYAQHKGWLVCDRKLVATTREALLAQRDDKLVLTPAVLHNTLGKAGIRPDLHAAWLDVLGGFTAVDGGWLRSGSTVNARALAVLRYYQRPMTVTELMPLVADGLSLRSTRQRLLKDPAFRRIDLHSHLVPADVSGYCSYTRVVDAIAQVLRAADGGRMRRKDLLDTVVDRYYNVGRRSVERAVATPMFVRRDGWVSLRPAGRNSSAAAAAVVYSRSCYQSVDGTFMWRIPVSRHLLRGSGCTMPTGLSRHLKIVPGVSLDVATADGPVRMSWPLSRARSASIGSLRRFVLALDLALGDFLLCYFTGGRLTCSGRTQEEVAAAGGLARLALLLGCPEGDADGLLPRIAAQLGVCAEGSLAAAIAMQLRRHHEDALLPLLEGTNTSSERV